MHVSKMSSGPPRCGRKSVIGQAFVHGPVTPGEALVFCLFEKAQVFRRQRHQDGAIFPADQFFEEMGRFVGLRACRRRFLRPSVVAVRRVARDCPGDEATRSPEKGVASSA